MYFSTKRIYTDTSQFDNGKFLFAHPFAQSLEWLYDDDNFTDERYWFYGLDGILPLCDFMTVVSCVVSYACNDFGESNIKRLINALEYEKETHKWFENTPFLKYEGDHLIIGKLRRQSTEVILWAAYLYCKVRSEIEDKSSKVHKGQALLYKLYTQKTGLKSEYVGESFLMRHYDETRNSFFRHIKDSNDFKQLLKQAKVTKSNDQKPDMEQSVLSKIPSNNIRYYYEGWRNGMKGSFVQEDGLYRFYEMHRDENGNLIEVHEKKEDNPIVVKGIVSNWLMFNSHMDLILKRLTKYNTDIPENIRQQFEKYTTMRFNQFKAGHRDDPDAWDWDWEYEFYGRIIIPQEMGFNKQSEALFDYIMAEDVIVVRRVMANYIKYLKKCREERGYCVTPELMVLRTIDTLNDSMLEDLSDDEVTVILDKLEHEGYVQVAWVGGHKAEAFRLFPKGKVYMKQLEERARTEKNASAPATEPEKPVSRKVDRKNTQQDYSQYSFELKPKGKYKNVDKLLDLIYTELKDKKFIADLADIKIDEEISQLINIEDKNKMVFKAIFTGKDTDYHIMWTGTIKEAGYFINQLEARGALSWKRGPRKWQITRNRIWQRKEKSEQSEVTGKVEKKYLYAQFDEDAFNRLTPPADTSELDKILDFVAPPIEKEPSQEISDEIKEEFNGYADHEDNHENMRGKMLGNGYRDTSHKAKE